MKFPVLYSGKFVTRENRFAVVVYIDGHQTLVHLPNSGRLPGLLIPGSPVWLSKAGNPNRKTRYDLILVERQGILISIDARLPNVLVEEAIKAEKLIDYAYPNIHREVQLGDSRIDLLLSDPEGICWVETKSVTLGEDGAAIFPDAPTSRGKRHLLALADSLSNGTRTSIIFAVQRPDADRFRPNWSVDFQFAQILTTVADLGVEVRAYTAEVNFESNRIFQEIPCIYKGYT